MEEATKTLVEKHLELLGHRAKDKITGLEGVVTSVCFDLYGCMQVILHPGLDKDKKFMEQAWFDVSRVEVLGKAKVLTAPFHKGQTAQAQPPDRGPAEKPSLRGRY